MSRAYNIQINVGDLDHELIGLNDHEAAAWVRGFQSGLHGKSCAEGHGASAQLGNSFGYACWERTRNFMARAAEYGRRSAVVRKDRYGTAQPKVLRECVEGASKVLRPFPEVTINHQPVTSSLERGAGQSPAHNNKRVPDESQKGLHTSKEEKVESIQHPASSIHETGTYDTTYVEEQPPAGFEAGVSTPDPLPKPAHMTRFESQYSSKPLPFDQTRAGKAVAAKAAEIRSMRLSKESQ